MSSTSTFHPAEVSWVVEALRPGTVSWTAMTNAGDNEELGRALFTDWLKSKARSASAVQYRLVKRTAVITDEVIREG